MPEYKYLMKVAIDFGSTNTVMAWRVYDVLNDGKLVVSENLNPIRNIKRIPSVMIFKKDNPANEGVKGDLYGDAATEVIRNSNIPPVVCDNFKQSIYTNPAESEEYKKGKETITGFFRCLRAEYKQEMYNTLPDYVRQSLKVVLYLSTPVRAQPTHRTLMREIAIDAGFTRENGVTEICTDYDEVRCIVRYAMEQRKEQMKNVLTKAVKPDGAILLFIDVGGSTMDMSLENLRIGEDGSETMDNISSWPGVDVQYPLGGCQVDEAIKDYLIRSGYADKEYTEEKWSHGDGKFRFRMFKEENNLCLKSDRSIEKLGKVATVCYDYDDDIIPEKNYNRSTEKINPEIYEKEICKEYISKMLDAINSVFTDQRTIEGRAPIKPEDVDAIFLAGDGSRLYFISEILRGKHPDHDPGFTQIKENPKVLFDDWENPSHCCALGALAEQESVVMLSYARDTYIAEIKILEHGALQPGAIESIAMNSFAGEATGCYLIYGSKELGKWTRIADKYQALPVEKEVKETFSYDDHASPYITVWVSVCRIKDDGTKERIGRPITISRGRKLGAQLKKIADWIVVIIGRKGSGRKARINANIKYKFTLSENYQLRIDLSLTSKQFNVDGTFSKDI